MPRPTGPSRAALVAAVTIVALSACSEDVPAARTSGTSVTDSATIATRPTTAPPAASSATPSAETTATSPATAAPTSTTTAAPTSTTSTTTMPAVPTTLDRSGSIYDDRPASDLPPPPLPDGWATEVVGTSASGRDLVAIVRPAAPAQRTVLVIGGLHGNEPVSPPTVRGLVDASVPDDIAVWLVPEANPDGVASGTRLNGNGVDLNRNFSWDWRESDGGPGPLSEPETQALTELVERLQPDVVVWVHQPYGYAGSIGPTDPAFEEAWSVGSGVPVRSGVTQHGGGESWTAFVAGRPSMLIEVDSWSATPDAVAAHRGGFEALISALP